MLAPLTIQVEQDGRVWVLDPPQGRLSAFDAEGAFERSVRIPGPAFAVLPGGQGILLSPTFSQVPLLWNDSLVELPIQLDVMNTDHLTVPVLRRWLATTTAGANVILVENSGGGLFAVHRDSTTGSWLSQSIHLPRAVHGLAHDKVDQRRRLVAQFGANSMVPVYRNVQGLASGAIWMEAGWKEMLGAIIDYQARRITVVLSSDQNEHSHLRASALIDDSNLLVIHDDGVRSLTLRSTAVPDWLR